MSEDRCICCGEIVPEGRMVCPGCEKKAEKERDLAEELVSKWARGELVERKKGKWILADVQRQEDVDNGNYRFICSECGKADIHSKAVTVSFCWNCGADMREEKTDVI